MKSVGRSEEEREERRGKERGERQRGNLGPATSLGPVVSTLLRAVSTSPPTPPWRRPCTFPPPVLSLSFPFRRSRFLAGRPCMMSRKDDGALCQLVRNRSAMTNDGIRINVEVVDIFSGIERRKLQYYIAISCLYSNLISTITLRYISLHTSDKSHQKAFFIVVLNRAKNFFLAFAKFQSILYRSKIAYTFFERIFLCAKIPFYYILFTHL